MWNLKKGWLLLQIGEITPFIEKNGKRHWRDRERGHKKKKDIQGDNEMAEKKKKIKKK